jgi:hypothetical protein
MTPQRWQDLQAIANLAEQDAIDRARQRLKDVEHANRPVEDGVTADDEFTWPQIIGIVLGGAVLGVFLSVFLAAVLYGCVALAVALFGGSLR